MLSSTIVLALSVAAVASAHRNEARAHRAAVAKRSESSVGKRDQFSGVPMTWYPTDTGADACTGTSHSANDWVVAMASEHFAGGSGCCGKKIRIDYNGKSTVASCVDECPSCVDGRQLDMTRGLLTWLAGAGTDEIYASWSYADGDDNGGDNDGGDNGKKSTPTPPPPPPPSPTPPPPPPKTTTSTPPPPPPPKTTSTTKAHPTSSSVKPSSSSSVVKQSSSSSAPASSASPSAPSASPSASAGGVANAGSDTGSSDAGVGGSGSANAGSSPGSPAEGSTSSDDEGAKQVSGALTGTNGALSVAVSGKSVLCAVLAGAILFAGLF